MKILVIGQGGREHALAWKLAQSPAVEQVFVAPGNGGSALEPKVRNLAIKSLDFTALAAFAREEKIAFTLVGPEAPLAAGIVDYFQAQGLKIIGPTQSAARLESSKAFAKALLKKYGIPTASYENFSDMDAALAYVATQSFPLVIKADGLAAGKGVTIAQNMTEAGAALNEIFIEQRFGSGQGVVIEEFLTGREVSFIVLTDGTHYQAFPACQDYKRLKNHNQGPNTGGMGGLCPSPLATAANLSRWQQEIIEATLAALKSEDIAYQGFLYAGLMVSPDGRAQVLEFNCRLGDPETQLLMLLLKSDLALALHAFINGQAFDWQWHEGVSLTVVLAAAGYPETVTTGIALPMALLENFSEIKVFHAGTTLVNDQLILSGGRGINVSAQGENFKEAREKIYGQLSALLWPGAQYRQDIGLNE
jgi:phosphoribosylamine--glycine ligase